MVPTEFFPSSSVSLENVSNIHAHTECICRVWGQGTQILDFPLWEEESSLVIFFNQQFGSRSGEEGERWAEKQIDWLDEP